MRIENQHIEFKSSFNDEVIITLVAFANATGGKVYVGLDDNGEVVSNFSVGKKVFNNGSMKSKTRLFPVSYPMLFLKRRKAMIFWSLLLRSFQLNPYRLKEGILKG